MLSLTYLKAEQASAYYDVVTKAEYKADKQISQSEYYLKKHGQYFGKCAKYLGLNGIVLKKDFGHLLSGHAPNGGQLIKPGQNNHHRAGYDYTFSAPKSLSIITEILADPELKKQLYDAHEEAVKVSLSYLEKNYATARETKSGVTQTVQTGNMLFATFTENSSRQDDPQIHSHTVIFNITKRSDDQFRAIMNEPIHNYKMFLGQMYRNQLAKHLQEMGFSIQQKGKGLFEIQAVPQELLDEFSIRSTEIADHLKILRRKYPFMNLAKLKEMAAIATRKKKESTSQEQLHNEWQERLKRHVKNSENLLKHVMNQKTIKAEQLNHIDLALKVLTEEESVVTKEQLMHTALKLSLGEKTMPELKKDLQSSKEVRTIEKDKLYTSKEIQEIEKNIVRHIRDNQQTFRQRFSRQAWLRLLPQINFRGLTKDQKKALQFILTENDKVVSVQGDAGTGKTTMLKLAANKYSGLGYKVITLGPTARSVEELSSNKLPNPQTIDRFLLTANKKKESQTALYIIDEASMLGSKKFKQILDHTKARDKIILVGDSKQKQSIEQGNIFSKLQQHNVIKTVRMKENVRQKDKVMKSTVARLAEKDIASAFSTLAENKKIRVVEDSIERIQEIADQYMQNYKSKDTLLIVETNTERKELNDNIRHKMLDNRSISRNSVNLTIAHPKNIRNTERNLSVNYEVNDFFFLRQNINGIQAGAEGKIQKIDHNKNSILCEFKDKKRSNFITIDLTRYGQYLSLYRKEEREFSKGDKIIFLKNDKKLGVENGTTAKIQHISTHQIRAITDKHKQISFHPKSYPYLELGYATTLFKSQGLTTKEVIYLADTQNQIDFNSFYVAATRAKNNIQIYTNDQEQLRDQVMIEQTKTSTLDYSLDGQERELTIEKEF